VSRAPRGRAALALGTGLLATASVLGIAGAPALGATTAAARASAQAPTPRLKLITAQRNITVQQFGNQVFLDPGIWVASFDATFRLNVRRASYSKPLTITEVIGTGSRTRTRRLPHWTLARWQGLKNFAQLTVRNHVGKIVATRKITFCPDTFDPERTGPSSAPTSGFPEQCGAFDPFPLATVWGITRGWAADPAEGGGQNFNLALGRYQLTETITPAFARLFHISARDARAKVAMNVVKGQGCCGVNVRSRPAVKPLPSLPHVRTLSSAPKNALPDLVALPSFGISTSNFKASKTKPAKSFLNFGATVWVGGTSQLDVQGFRKSGSPTMQAYQYFWRNGRIVGRVRAGTMGFDSEHGHDHWHFQQFARYQLLNASKKVAVRSQKVGFCIAPTDGVDLLLPHATWQPSFLGFEGQCGSPSALWVQEEMPIGWGYTYIQSLAGQSFNLAGLPNGTYYVEIIANPEHVLHEVTRSNDISLRKVIIGGTPGHRQVQVPAFHDIDPEK
jgi:hypothetical protein